MTYADDLDDDFHDRAFYVAFDGIETRIASEDVSLLGVSGTYVVGLEVSSIAGGARTLNRERHVVEDAGFGFTIIDDDDGTIRGILRRRGGTDDTLGAVLTSSGTTVTLGSGTNTYANGTAIYVDRETITLGAHTGSGVYTGCTRAAHGSTAIEHGLYTVVSSVPRHIYTRGVVVYEVMRSTGTTQAILRGKISSEPSWEDGMWKVACTSLMDDFLTRPICTGWRDVEPETTTVADDGTVTFGWAASEQRYEFATGQDTAVVRVDVADRTGFFFFDAADLTTSGLTIDLTRQIRLDQSGATDPGGFTTSSAINNLDLFRGNPKVTLRQVHFVDGTLGRAMLKVIMSDNGDSGYDVLPGRHPDATAGTSYYYRRRMGAGIPASLVDQNSFRAVVVGTEQDRDPLDDEERLGDYLERALWRTGRYALTDSTGRLALAEYASASVRGALTTYNASSGTFAAAVVSTDVETDTPGHARVTGNYDPIERKYRRTLDLVWFDDAGIYADRDQGIRVASKSIRIGYGAESYAALDSAFDRVRARRAYAGRRTSWRVEWRYWQTFIPGARFAFTDSRIPDHEGGLGVTARYVEVTRWEPDWEQGFVTIELDEVPRGWVFAPSAIVASATAGADPTITLATTGIAAYLSPDGKPAQDFPLAAPIRIHDASDNFLTVTTLQVVSRPSDTQLACLDTPTFTIAAGDRIEVGYDVDQDVGVNDVGADMEDFAFGAGSDYKVGTGGDERDGPRWS